MNKIQSCLLHFRLLRFLEILPNKLTLNNIIQLQKFILLIQKIKLQQIILSKSKIGIESAFSFSFSLIISRIEKLNRNIIGIISIDLVTLFNSEWLEFVEIKT